MGHGLVRLADDVQQRPRRRSAPRTEVREQLLAAAAEQLEAARPTSSWSRAVRVKGSPDRSVSIADLAGCRHGDYLGKGSGDVPEAGPSDIASHCVGDLGLDVLPRPRS